MHLVQYIIEQRNAILEYLTTFGTTGVKVSKSQITELNEDFEYIMKKHADALHKRCGTNIYPKNNGYKGGLDTNDSWTVEDVVDLYKMPKEDE
tara:strand:+ start:673 stop:951 length:279 start_codon:yes stop_codon:yes gene_type:complete